jgi:hypothetical protein
MVGVSSQKSGDENRSVKELSHSRSSRERFSRSSSSHSTMGNLEASPW